MIRSYREMKSAYSFLVNYCAHLKKAEKDLNLSESDIIALDAYKADLFSKFKKDCREFYKRQRRWATDPFSVPVLNSKSVWRTVSTDGGETGTDFIIVPDNGQTDEDIKEFVYDTVFCGYGDLLYDCTGEKCTRGWSYRKVACGIVITHDWVYDF